MDGWLGRLLDAYHSTALSRHTAHTHTLHTHPHTHSHPPTHTAHTHTLTHPAHCDFVKLREMLLRTNMEDLRETTHYKHYEVFRRERLAQMGFADSVDGMPVR